LAAYPEKRDEQIVLPLLFLQCGVMAVAAAAVAAAEAAADALLQQTRHPTQLADQDATRKDKKA
jgi:hypothetical protein